MAEIAAGFCIMVIALLLLFIRTQFLIAIIACVLIIVIGMEKRGSRFDRIVSIVVIMLFSIGFMML